MVYHPPPFRYLSSSAVHAYLLDAFLDAINLSAVDLLAGLLNGAEDSLVLESWLSDHGRGLVVEGDGVGLDTWTMC